MDKLMPPLEIFSEMVRPQERLAVIANDPDNRILE